MSTMKPFTDGGAMTNVLAHKFTSAGQFPGYSAGNGAFGVSAITPGGGTIDVLCPSNPATTFVHLWFKVTALPSSGNKIIMAYYDASIGSRQCYLACDSTGRVSFFLNNGTQIGTWSTSTISAGVQIHIQTKVTIALAGAGFAEVKINGTIYVTNSSVTTQTTGNAFSNRIRFEPSDGFFSHIIIFDSGGSAPNNYLGVRKILTEVPTADSATGGLNQFTPTPSQSAGSHFLNVNEEPPNDDTSYNADTVANDRESYRYANLSGVTTIDFINAWIRHRIDDAGPHTDQIIPRNNAVDDATGPTFSIPANYVYDWYTSLTDPNTSAAWTQSGFNGSGNSNAEFGVKMIS